MTEQQQTMMMRDAGFIVFAKPELAKFEKLIELIREATIRECADRVIFWVSVVILIWLVGQAELPKATQPSPTQCTLKLTDRVGFAHLVTGEAQ
jgi:hypothetical protein